MGVLSKLVIAVVGSHPHELSQIRKWVEANGGRWSAGVKKDVTHLIASKEAWKSQTDKVQQASNLGAWIVSYDWFEDSLQGKRKLGEKKYTWEFLGKERKKRKQLKRLGAAADGTSKNAAVVRKPKLSKSFFFSTSTPSIPSTPFVSATEDLKRRRAEREAAQVANKASEGQAHTPIEIEDGSSDQAGPSSSSSALTSVTSARSALTKNVLPSPAPKKKDTIIAPHAGTQAKIAHFKDLYHYYLDTTGFEYKIVLVRSDTSLNSFARYHIGLLESHTKPHKYCTIVQYTPPAKKASDAGSDVPGLLGLRSVLLDFLKKGENIAVQQHEAASMLSTDQHPEAARPQSLSTSAESSHAIPQQGPIHHPYEDTEQHSEAARLASLVMKPTPSPDTPYKAFVCPINSSYPSAWRAFRHVFRDLTLLSWEERFDQNRTIQKARAQQLSIEPFLYAKPKKGLPMGLLPQEPGLLQGSTGGLEVRGDIDDGYFRNGFNLPSIAHPLSKNGAIGASIQREEEERKRKEEENRIKAEEEQERERRMRGEVREKKPNYNMPFYNGVTGRPQTDAWGRYTSSVPDSGGRSGAGAYLGIKTRRPFMRERYE